MQRVMNSGSKKSGDAAMQQSSAPNKSKDDCPDGGGSMNIVNIAGLWAMPQIGGKHGGGRFSTEGSISAIHF